jgi:acyl carrier protein
MISPEAVVEFFRKLLPIPGATLQEQLGYEYLTALDSMGVVQMVTDIEATFGIEFSPEDMQSNEFRTVGGVLAILQRNSVQQKAG